MKPIHNTLGILFVFGLLGCKGPVNPAENQVKGPKKAPIVASKTKPAEKPQSPVPTAPILKTKAPLAVENYIEAKVMVRGYCHAGSGKKDIGGRGGFGPSMNLPRSFEGKHQKNSVYLIAKPSKLMSWGKHRGMALQLINETGKGRWFSASDSRLSIIQEAQDKSGAWKPIEYLPSSWCGNSYHRVHLGAGEFWEFATPRYRGPIKTNLRFRLKDGKNGDILSNVFAGSIHPAQFSVKQGYKATNIMDPYNN